MTMTDNNLLSNNKIKYFDIRSQGSSRNEKTGRSQLTQDQKNHIQYWISLRAWYPLHVTPGKK